jgi:hypothetical protein
MECALLNADAGDFHLTVSGLLRNTAADTLQRTLDPFGLPPSSVRLQLRTFDADFCGVLRAVRSVAVHGDAVPRMALQSPDPLSAGQNLRFRLQTPSRPTYVHVYFFGSAGQVGNMVQSSQPYPASSNLEFGEPYWAAAAPFGTGLLVAITSDHALYTTRRPAVEEPSTALSAISYAIESAQRRGERVEARVITATSVPSQ